MTNERKYQDEEVKEILGLAANRAEVGRPAVSDEGGLTLSELQGVGLEVGMDPGRIAEAALVLDTRREVTPRRTYMGVPISVRRLTPISRATTSARSPPSIRFTSRARPAGVNLAFLCTFTGSSDE